MKMLAGIEDAIVIHRRIWARKYTGFSGLMLALVFLGSWPEMGAAQRPPQPPSGLPQCQQNLNTCTANLTTCNTQLTVCQSATPPLIQTGQTICWDNLNRVVACPGTGQDGDSRVGAPLNYTDNGDGTITDNNTKLVWEKKSADGTIHDQNATYNWSDAFAVHLAGLNASNFAGHSDWRLPSISELQSILNYAVSNPSVSPVFNTNCAPGATVLTGSCTQSGVASFYWTSTAVASNPAAAWIICFGGADSALGSNPGNKIAPLYVRAVRGGSPRYTDKGDGTILDNHTKLVWEKKSADGSIHDKELTYTWYDAFAVHVAGLNAAGFAGHNDWRLPNERELENIIEYEKADPAIPLVFNVNCSSGTTVLTGSCTAATPAVYWSSTTDALNAGEAWIVQPDSGLQTTTDKRIPFHVRAVRTGP